MYETFRNRSDRKCESLRRFDRVKRSSRVKKTLRPPIAVVLTVFRDEVSAVKDKYTVYARGDFVHVELETGFQISLATMQRLWSTVIPTCEEQNARCVLVEGDGVTHVMHARDAWNHANLLSDLTRYPLRIAFCLYGYQPDELSHSFASIASSRANAVKFFSDIEKSLRWLRN